MTPGREVTVGWARAGTALFCDRLGALGDDALRGPSGLPGWTRAHVAAHVARNADALGRLLSWARTGVETPMYPDPAQRDAEIKAGALAPAAALRADVAATAAALDRAFEALPPAAWSTPVRTARGRVLPVAQVPWLRVREVWLHAVDLDAGATFADLPGDVVTALLEDVASAFAARADTPALRLRALGRGGTWSIGRPAGDAPTAEVPEVAGAPADLLGWLTGRAGGDRLDSPGVLPVLPAWL